MKLKKVLSGLMAAVMAVTSSVVMTATVGAAGKSILADEVVIGDWDASVEIAASNFADLDFDGTEYLAVDYYSQNVLNQYYCAMKLATKDNYASLLEPSVPNIAEEGAITILFPITASYSAIATDGLQIQGYDITVTDVKLFDNVTYDSITTGETVIGDWDASVEIAASNFADLDFDGTEYLAVDYYSQNVLNQYYCAMKLATKDNYASLLEPSVPNIAEEGAITILFPITASYSAIATDGLQIQGYDITVTNVSIIDDVSVANNAITISNTIENGEVEASAETAVAGTEITLTATPAEGYELDAYTVKDASDNTVTVTDGKFTMPASAVTVSATFKKVPTDPVQVAYDAIVAYLETVTFDNDFHATKQAEAITALVKEKAPDARVDSSFIVNVATYTDAGSVKGTIQIIADGSELKTITVDEVIAVLANTDSGNVIWSGSTDLGTDWGTSITVKFDTSKLAAGDTVKVTYKAGTAAEYQQIKLMNGDWTVLESPTGKNEWDAIDLSASATTYEFKISDADVKLLNGTMIVSGFNATISSVEIVPAASNYTDPVNTTIPENKIVTQKTAVADGVYNQRFIKKVKASELVDATKIIFTVSNGTFTATYESTKCYSSLNVNGGSISAGDDYVFLGLTIKGIPEDVTVTIKGIEIVY